MEKNKSSSLKKTKQSSGRSEKSRSKDKTTKVTRRTNRKITKKHPEFELTYDMMMGIRTTVSRAEASMNNLELKREMFKAKTQLRFPKEGSIYTPAHNMKSFKFKDYCPDVFKTLRRLFKVDPSEYLISLCSDFPYLEFVSNSNSGQFFFYSHDRRFMIKTQSKEECHFLRKILPSYVKHVEQEPNTLLAQFLGMHRVKISHKTIAVYFIIMSSVFYSTKFINEVFDLKGSTQGRSAKKEERNQEVPIFKDNDFVDNGVRINLGKELRQGFFEQLHRDFNLLVSMSIMDYSLILGIHFCDDNETLSINSEEMGHPTEKMAIFKRQSVFAIKKNREVISPYQKKFKAKAIPLDFSDIKESKRKMELGNLFTHCFGGVKSKDKLRIYFLGIIDILQEYNVRKKIERKIKSLKYDINAISVNTPTKYAQRLINFLEKYVD